MADEQSTWSPFAGCEEWSKTPTPVFQGVRRNKTPFEVAQEILADAVGYVAEISYDNLGNAAAMDDKRHSFMIEPGKLEELTQGHRTEQIELTIRAPIGPVTHGDYTLTYVVCGRYTGTMVQDFLAFQREEQS